MNKNLDLCCISNANQQNINNTCLHWKRIQLVRTGLIFISINYRLNKFNNCTVLHNGVSIAFISNYSTLTILLLNMMNSIRLILMCRKYSCVFIYKLLNQPAKFFGRIMKFFQDSAIIMLASSWPAACRTVIIVWILRVVPVEIAIWILIEFLFCIFYPIYIIRHFCINSRGTFYSTTITPRCYTNQC